MSQKLFSLSKKTKAIFLVIILMGIAIFVFQNARPNGGGTSLSSANPPVRPAYLNGINLIGLSSKINPTRGSLQNIVINAGEFVLIDRDVDIGSLTIQAGGELHCPINLDPVTVRVTSIIVNGKLQCGAIGAPYQGEMYFVLKHDGSALPTVGDFSAENAEEDLKLKVPSTYRAILINNGGAVDFNGANDRVAWTKLAASANKGDSFILVDNGRGWRLGDTITIAPTGFDYSQFDQVQVTGFMKDAETGKLRVNFTPSLKYFHNGITQTINAPATGAPANLPAQTVRLDERAEVAVLNRHIIITSDTEGLDPNDTTLVNAPYIGGHMMAMAGSMAYIDGAEFSQMGQMGIMGRYPFHWHKAGDVTGQYIKNSSIHDTFQRCVTVHGSHNALVDRNLCYNHQGHGFFLEDGNETGNFITHNLGMFSKRPPIGRELLQSDINDNQAQRFLGPSTFWISNPQNTVINNTASGYFGTGFWMAFCGELGPCKKMGIGVQNNIDTTAFNSNSAHSGAVGITWDGAPVYVSAKNPRNKNDFVVSSSHYHPTKTPVFNSLLAYKNYLTGIYMRGSTAIYNNALLADNGWNLFFAYNQIVKNSSVIGRSNNFNQDDENYHYKAAVHGLTGKKMAGIVIYDGPFELDSVRFLNYPTSIITRTNQKTGKSTGEDITPQPFAYVGGARRFSNEVKGLQFFPEPYKRITRGIATADTVISTSIRDLDGSLTGVAGALVLRDDSMNRSSECLSWTGTDQLICHPSLRLGRLNFRDRGKGLNVPYVVQRISPEMVKSYSFSDLEVKLKNIIDGSVNNKFNILNDGSQYTVIFRPDDMVSVPDMIQGPNSLAVGYQADLGSELSPVIRLSGRGSQCRLESNPNSKRGAISVTRDAIKVKSLAALNASAVSSYYTDNENFYFRIRATSSLRGSNFTELLYSPESISKMGTKEEQSKSRMVGTHTVNYDIVCDDSVSRIKGSVDSSGATDTVGGWVCDYGDTRSSNVHIYVNGKAGVGRYIGSALANLPSEMPVAIACGTTGVAYRFRYTIPKNIKSSLKGQQVYVHGISLSRKSNNLLGYSNPLAPPTVK